MLRLLEDYINLNIQIDSESSIWNNVLLPGEDGKSTIWENILCI